MRIPVLLAALLLAASASAGIADDRPRPRIEVTGVGEAALVPDMAVVELTVARQAESARAALDAANAAMAAVLTAMSEEGIEARDLQTSGFSIIPQMTYPSDGRENEAPKIVGYLVSNSLTVRIRDLARLGAVIDRSVTLGVNQGGQIAFTHSDPSAVIEAARAGAMKDAVRRAGVLAEAAGGKVGRVLLIAEPPAASDPVPLKRLEMAMRTADAVPVAAGENTYRVTVNAVFELDQ